MTRPPTPISPVPRVQTFADGTAQATGSSPSPLWGGVGEGSLSEGTFSQSARPYCNNSSPTAVASPPPMQSEAMPRLTPFARIA
ncbi:hypothetical protein ABIA22_000038 [Sinorhizobium fredii]